MTDKQALTKARNHIQQHGFCKGALADADGRVCTVGALAAAVFGDPHSTRESEQFYSAIRALEDTVGVRNIVNWNNDPSRTESQVIAGFNKAIKAQN